MLPRHTCGNGNAILNLNLNNSVMVPPPTSRQTPSHAGGKTQRAADALLDRPFLASKLRRASVAGRSSSSACSANEKERTATVANGTHRTPRAPQHPARPTPQGSGAAAATGRKRPLCTRRGNDAGPAAANNCFATSRSCQYARPASSGPALFDRRHARDRVSRKEAPATATARRLEALLDGPAAPTRTHHTKESRGRTRRGDAKRQKTQSNVAAAREFHDPDAALVVAPPPMPSYGKPRPKEARGSGSHSHQRGLLMATHELPRLRKRGSSHTSYAKKDAAAAQGAVDTSREKKSLDDELPGHRRRQKGEGYHAFATAFSVGATKETGKPQHCQPDDTVSANAVASASFDNNTRTGNASDHVSRPTAGNDVYGGRGVRASRGITMAGDATQDGASANARRQDKVGTPSVVATTGAARDRIGSGRGKRPASRAADDASQMQTREVVGATSSLSSSPQAGAREDHLPVSNRVGASTAPSAAAVTNAHASSVVEGAAHPKIPDRTKEPCSEGAHATPRADGGEVPTLARIGIGGGGHHQRGMHGRNRYRGVPKKSYGEGPLRSGGGHEGRRSSSPQRQSGAEDDATSEAPPAEDVARVLPSREEGAHERREFRDDDHVLPTEGHGGNDGQDNRQDSKQTIAHAEWFDPEEDALLQKQIAARKNTANGAAQDSKRVRRSHAAQGHVNDNFVRLDLRNAAGSCRGARNLKRANKQKLWRATHMFGMSERDSGAGGGNAHDDGGARRGGDGVRDGATGGARPDVDASSDYGAKRYGGKHGQRRGSTHHAGGDARCFLAAKHGGVDPLDDFVDGVFSVAASGGNDDQGQTQRGTDKTHPSTTTVAAPQRGVPLCTRHQRPCKLLVVKRNHKGNKGRQFYVCCMPRGEQCDFFQWEEDTIEVSLPWYYATMRISQDA